MNQFALSSGAALVTGAASGIGQAIAWAIAESGAPVGLLDLPSADLSASIEGCHERGARSLALPADVTSAAEVTAAVSEVENKLGELHYAVNAAGIARSSPAEDMDPAEWQLVYDIDVTGLFLCCQAQGRVMLSRGRGSIVNIASMSGTIANRGLKQVHYNSAKAAVMQMSTSLAAEWADRGVRVTSLSPGYTATPMNIRPEMAAQVQSLTDQIPMGRYANPEEIAGPAVFLLSDAASYCTGVDLIVDGGVTAW